MLCISVLPIPFILLWYFFSLWLCIYMVNWIKELICWGSFLFLGYFFRCISSLLSLQCDITLPLQVKERGWCGNLIVAATKYLSNNLNVFGCYCVPCYPSDRKPGQLFLCCPRGKWTASLQLQKGLQLFTVNLSEYGIVFFAAFLVVRTVRLMRFICCFVSIGDGSVQQGVVFWIRIWY